MVCRHCVECVRRILVHDIGIAGADVELGSVRLDSDLTPAQLSVLESALQQEGFELIKSREIEIVDGIKRLLIDASRSDTSDGRVSFQRLLDGRYGLSFTSLSRLFSEVEGRSIENYFVGLRVERVKELIKYRSMTLSEIADTMGYSSVSHLSRQFKQVTGLTPSEFKSLGAPRRPLPDL